MDKVNQILEGHILSLAVVALVVVGAVKSIMGDITYDELVTTLGPIVGLTAIGRGVAAYKKQSLNRWDWIILIAISLIAAALIVLGFSLVDDFARRALVGGSP